MVSAVMLLIIPGLMDAMVTWGRVAVVAESLGNKIVTRVVSTLRQI